MIKYRPIKKKKKYNNDIGCIAGIIWNVLFKKGELTVQQISEIIGLKEIMVTLALGWLAKEEKVIFFEDDGAFYANLTSNPDLSDFHLLGKTNKKNLTHP
jgi:hypothetical protein